MPPERNKIQKHIHRLRQKPEHVRRRYAATISGIVVAFIAIIWVATIPSRFPNLLGSNSSSEQAAVVTGLNSDNTQSPAQSPTDQTSQIENNLNQGDNYSPAPSEEPLPTNSSNDSVDSESNNSNNNSSNTDGVIILTPENQSQ